MRRHGPVKIIMYCPKTAEGKDDLSRRVASVHADAVNERLKHLNTPSRQKLQLLDAIIEDVKKSAPYTTAE